MNKDYYIKHSTNIFEVKYNINGRALSNYHMIFKRFMIYTYSDDAFQLKFQGKTIKINKRLDEALEMFSHTVVFDYEGNHDGPDLFLYISSKDDIATLLLLSE